MPATVIRIRELIRWVEARPDKPVDLVDGAAAEVVAIMDMPTPDRRVMNTAIRARRIAQLKRRKLTPAIIREITGYTLDQYKYADRYRRREMQGERTDLGSRAHVAVPPMVHDSSTTDAKQSSNPKSEIER